MKKCHNVEAALKCFTAMEYTLGAAALLTIVFTVETAVVTRQHIDSCPPIYIKIFLATFETENIDF